MFALIVVVTYCLVKPTIENTLKIDSFIAYMLRNIAHLVMENMTEIYYYQGNDNQNAIHPRLCGCFSTLTFASYSAVQEASLSFVQILLTQNFFYTENVMRNG